jgi:hypothetical protein
MFYYLLVGYLSLPKLFLSREEPVVFRNLMKVSYRDLTCILKFFAYKCQGKTGITGDADWSLHRTPEQLSIHSGIPIYQYNASISIYQLATNRPQCLDSPRTSHYQL